MADAAKAKFENDGRPACRYGAKCYQKNEFHRKRYKHPPANLKRIDKDDDDGSRRTGRKRKIDDRDRSASGSPENRKKEAEVDKHPKLHELSSSDENESDAEADESSRSSRKEAGEEGEEPEKSEKLEESGKTGKFDRLGRSEDSDNSENSEIFDGSDDSRDSEGSESFRKLKISGRPEGTGSSKRKEPERGSGEKLRKIGSGEKWEKIEGGEKSRETGSGEKWKETGSGEESKETGSGGEWEKTGSGGKSKKIEGGEKSKKIGSGEESKETGSGGESKETGSGEKWKKTGSGEKWKKTEGGEKSKKIERSEKWKETGSGEKSKETGSGEKSRETGSGEKWKKIEGDEKSKKIEGGEKSKETGSGEKSKETGSGKKSSEIEDVRNRTFGSSKESEEIGEDGKSKISEIFSFEMPADFYRLHDFCAGISKEDPSSALKIFKIKLVGPYDVLTKKITSYRWDDKEAYLRHWRYYYDPPEFQTVIKGDDKSGLHYGYWRDEPDRHPVFVAKNEAEVNCVIEPVAENIFGALNAHMENEVKTANPFEKGNMARLLKRLKAFARDAGISLDRNTAGMKNRERKVVARTFHKAGIVVPFDKRTQLGYRDLAASDSALKKILAAIDASRSEDDDQRRMHQSKLDEVVRLATIAGDECDFGTCLELGHDLFSSGVCAVENTALRMLKLAYTQLDRTKFYDVAKAHLQCRTRPRVSSFPSSS